MDANGVPPKKMQQTNSLENLSSTDKVWDIILRYPKHVVDPLVFQIPCEDRRLDGPNTY